jgi:hypothetical protein
MYFTPYISIYVEEESIRKWFAGCQTKAIWIFLNNLGYNKLLSRKRVWVNV